MVELNEQRFAIENILVELESKIDRINCVLSDITDFNFDMDKKEFKTLYLKINIVSDYMGLLNNSIEKIYKAIYPHYEETLLENENAALTDQSNKLH